ncbi:MAG: polyheme membrane-associated cytochrome C [Alphaproteobacteria bacterium]|nr:polyheme membrane-associated cytochrome C [Alphaproteobacteria bacterium]
MPWKSLISFVLCLGFGLPVAAQEQHPAIPFLEAWKASPHANVKSESFIHWDKDGKVPVRCAMCHSGPGFVDFLGGDGSAAGKVDKPAPIRSVIDCVTCHNEKARNLSSVMFPSGLPVGNLGSSARCMVCHQGRQSTQSVNKATASLPPDTVSKELGFINVHYRAAAATLWGTGAKGGYEYAGKTYHGRFRHTPTHATCTQCHDPHRLTVKEAECAACHGGKALKDIRSSRVDYDGDGNMTEGIAQEIATLHGALGKAISAYAANIGKSPILYDSHHHPYFFTDKNANGAVDPGEAVRANAYKAWTPRLVRAAYNFQFIAKDPGAYAHNPVYAVQLLYDSLESLGVKVEVDLTKMTRP